MKLVRRLLWAAVLVAGIAVLAASRLGASSERVEKGSFGTVPAFALTDQGGRTVRDSDLRGRPWVANFIFTRCPSACPLLTAKFQALQEKVGSDTRARFVSITVDPEHDTPEVLAAYAAKYGADHARWTFLTGPLAEIEQTVVRGFKIHMGKPQAHVADPTLIDIMHGEHFVLIDANGTIRGYYRAEEPSLAELIRDLRAL